MRLSTCVLAAFVVLCLSPAHAETVQLEPYWNQAPGVLIAPMEIDGHLAHLLFDTGAGQTTLTPSFGQTLGCSPHGSISAFRMRGDRIEMKKCGQRRLRIGAHTIEREVASFDLRALLPAGAPPLDGITGLDALDGRLVTLDLANRVIRLDERPGHGWREGVVRFEREAGGAGLTAFVRVDAPTGALWMLLDSGHFGPVFLSPGALEQLGVASLEGPVHLAISGAGDRQVNAVRVDSLLYDGVLGEPFIKQFDIAIDLRRQRIWWRAHVGAAASTLSVPRN